MKPLSAIFALGENDALGLRGGLPWSYPEDSKYFDDVTTGHAVIMGRRTWEERGEPLAGRENIVVSKALAGATGARVVPQLTEALALAYSLDRDPFVIGGAALFKEAMPLVTRVYLTRIPASPEADTVFHFDPTPFDLESSRASGGLVFSVFVRRGDAWGFRP